MGNVFSVCFNRPMGHLGRIYETLKVKEDELFQRKRGGKIQFNSIFGNRLVPRMGTRGAEKWSQLSGNFLSTWRNRQIAYTKINVKSGLVS